MYRIAGDESWMDADGLMYAAELAYAGGLFDELPANADEALDAFEAIGIEMEQQL
jgi:hypothetical protein